MPVIVPIFAEISMPVARIHECINYNHGAFTPEMWQVIYCIFILYIGLQVRQENNGPQQKMRLIVCLSKLFLHVNMFC